MPDNPPRITGEEWERINAAMPAWCATAKCTFQVTGRCTLRAALEIALFGESE